MSCDQKICRGCLAGDRKMVSATLYEAGIKDLTGIDISPSERLPHWLCYECVALLRKCIKFRDKVTKSHYTLCQYVLKSVQYPSDKDDNPYLSRTCISHYDFPGTQSEQPENLTKDDVVNDMGISVSVEVESVKVEDNTALCNSEDTIQYKTTEECGEKSPFMDVASKPSSCYITELNAMSICSATLNYEKRADQGKIEDIINPGLGLNLERVKVKDENPIPDYDDNVAIKEISIEEQIELKSKTSTHKLDNTKLKKVEDNISLGVSDHNSQIVEIKQESSCTHYDDDDITIEEMSIEEQIELRSKSLTRKSDNKEQTELQKVKENIRLDVSDLNSEIVEIQDESSSSDYNDVIRLERSVEEQMKSRRKSSTRKPDHRKHTELGKLLYRVGRGHATTRRTRKHLDEDTDEEVDVVSLDTPQPTRKESLRLHSLRPRRYIKRTVDTATPDPRSTTRKRVPPPSLPTTSRRRTRGSDKHSHRSFDSEYESSEEGRRYLHNDMERQRRNNLNSLFNELKWQVPAARYARCTSKISILREATALCKRLSRENVEREELKMKQYRLMLKLKKLRGLRAPRKT